VAVSANFCPQCRQIEFQELSPESVARMASSEPLAVPAYLRLEASRLVIASILSGGLYIFFWLYITWKQLAQETHDVHFPVWHALTWTVPVYQVFRLHRHSTVIQGLAVQAGVPTTLDARTVVALALASFGLGLVSLLTVNAALATILGLLGIAVTTTIIVWNQGALNAYWVTRHGDQLRAAPMSGVERGIVLLGVLVWISTLAR
jgi:hypothetical protein